MFVFKVFRSQALLKNLNKRTYRSSYVYVIKNVKTLNQLRNYSIKGNKIEYLTSETQHESSVFRFLSSPVQQDMINSLTQYSKNDQQINFGTIKELIHKFIISFDPEKNSPDAKIAVYSYFLNLLKNLKYDFNKSVSENSSGIVNTEPVALYQIFSHEELLTIFKWLSQLMMKTEILINKKCFDDEASKQIFPEIFMALKDSSRISYFEKVPIYACFNKFLMYHKFEKQAVENLKQILNIIDSNENNLQLEKRLFAETLSGIQDIGVSDPIIIVEIFSLFKDTSDKKLQLLWFKLLIKYYNEKKEANIDNLIISKELETSDLLSSFLQIIIQRNDIKDSNDVEFYSSLVSILLENHLESKNQMVLNKISEYLRNKVFDKQKDLKISDKSLCAIISANIIDNDSNLVNEQLIQLVKKDKNSTLKELWDMILSWKIYKSFGDTIDSNVILLKEINEIFDLKLPKNSKNENKLKQSEDGEYELNFSFMDDDNNSYINLKTLNYFLIAACYSNKSKNFIYSIIEFFKTKTIRCNEVSYSIILLNYVRKNDIQSIQEIFQHSLDNGVQWNESANEANEKVLFRCIQCLFDNSRSFEELKDSFEFFNKIKNFLEDFDCNVVNSILVKFLQSNYIGDALELLDKEFILSEDNTTSKYYGKLNEDDTFNIENKSLNARKINLNNEYSHKIFITLYEFLLNQKNSDICWLVYGTIHRCFFNVPFDTYLPVMKKFNELKRPDASLLIFQQMKKLNRFFGLPSPNQSHYIYLLQAYGDMLYEDGVIELHAMLRMDLAVDKSIKLNNAILGAYTNLQDVIKCKNIFDEMLAIPSGNANAINSETINIMIKSNTYIGLSNVSSFWNNLSKIDYIPDATNYKQFIISNCYHGKPENAIDLIDEMEFNGLEVNREIIKLMYLWTEDLDKIKQITNWVTESEFSDIYQDLLESGEIDKNSVVMKD